jgi:cytochrome c1
MALIPRPVATAALSFCLLACSAPEPAREPRVVGDPEAGARVIARVACGVCHRIPGVPGARGVAGPSLAGFAQRSNIAGVAPNRASVLVQWIRDAPSIAPDTLMPPLPVSEREARNVAAYLYTLR